MRVNVLVRPARESDAQAVGALARSFAGSNPSPSATASADLAKAEDSLSWLLEAANSQVIVGEVGGDVVAVMVLATIPSLVHAGRCVLFMDLLVVAESHQRQGIGTAMVTRAAEEARSSGAYKLLLVTRTDNAAAGALYARCGFEVNGVGLALYA